MKNKFGLIGIFVILSFSIFAVDLELDENFIVNYSGDYYQILDIESESSRTFLLLENKAVALLDAGGNIKRVIDLQTDALIHPLTELTPRLINQEDYTKFLDVGGLSYSNGVLYVAYSNIIKMYDPNGMFLNKIELNESMKLSDIAILNSQIYVLDDIKGIFKIMGKEAIKIYPESVELSNFIQYNNLEIIDNSLYVYYTEGKEDQEGITISFIRGVYKLSAKDNKYVEEKRVELGEDSIINHSFISFENNLMLSKGESEIYIFDKDLNIKLYINSPKIFLYPKFDVVKEENGTRGYIVIYNHGELKRYFFDLAIPHKVVRWNIE
ncbi:hypothetical protein PW5551_10425 [Petrotoga sp. 9PW.55.5.1]|uniref:hypothetical protein n=1 Tax=Petrotoga sp. 9PW.55.5.1 TaxID=1308979 RepID=UPI000DC32124|nr:hypothetical protein [Petrotoga sp. 9PW.55.5.1]RAO98346.1 hypothetical protein PW5551_10425 [Petrotoga sp. 9PW.55.5.1]